MKREELHPQLKQEYTAKRGFGVRKVDNPTYRNVWFVVPPPPPGERPKNLPLKALGRAHQVLTAQTLLPEATELDLAVSFLLLNREAVSSSRMEGTWSTVDHVLSPGNDLLSEDLRKSTASVRAYANVLNGCYQEFRAKKYQAFTVRNVLKLHKQIMSFEPDSKQIAGILRSPGKKGSIVQIGGLGNVENSIYNPTPPEHVASCLDLVMAWYQDEALVEMGDAGMGLSLPLRLAIGHTHFEAVHPFRDGNGRVGRMLWPLQMICSGILPIFLSGYVEAEKKTYSEALQAAQKKLNYAPIVEFICDAIVDSHEELKVTMKYLKSLPAEWDERATGREGSASRRALAGLLAKPIFTVKELSERLSVSFEAASKAASKLVEDKIVAERTGFGRNRIFATEEVIHALAREFGQSLDIADTKARALLGLK